MQPGSPGAMLIEEIRDMLADAGHLTEYAAEVMDSAENKDEIYALAWYLFNTRQFKEHLAQTGFILGGTDGRPMSEFYGTSAAPSDDKYYTLHDLRLKNERLSDKLLNSRIAYDDYIRENRPIELLFKLSSAQNKLMTLTLNQAFDAKYE